MYAKPFGDSYGFIPRKVCQISMVRFYFSDWCLPMKFNAYRSEGGEGGGVDTGLYGLYVGSWGGNCICGGGGGGIGI